MAPLARSDHAAMLAVGRVTEITAARRRLVIMEEETARRLSFLS